MFLVAAIEYTAPGKNAVFSSVSTTAMGRTAQRKCDTERKEKQRHLRSASVDPLSSLSTTVTPGASTVSAHQKGTRQKKSTVPPTRTTRSRSALASATATPPAARTEAFPTLDTIEEVPSSELAQLPQSTPHPRQKNTHRDVHNHLFDQISLSFQADPDILDDGEDSEFKFPDDGQDDGDFIEEKEDQLDAFWANEMNEYDEDDTLLPEPVAPSVQASTAKPKGRGRPRKAQPTSKKTNAAKRAESKSAVSESDEESPESGASQYLCACVVLRDSRFFDIKSNSKSHLTSQTML